MKQTIIPLLASLLLTSLPAVAQETPRPVHYRKNIDDLTPAELAAFKHAVAELKRKSERNIYDRSGFLWQAWVHNCTTVQAPADRQTALPPGTLQQVLADSSMNSCDVRSFAERRGGGYHDEYPGECEHQKNTFLQWHRAQLYYYEQALRAADPNGERGPSTRDVALPYWNFTRQPSGVRYPKAFEDEGSPLFDRTRNTERLPSAMATASPYLLAYQIYYMDWAEFGGDQYGSNGGGALETRIHNHMHAFYIGGNMSDNVTAGMDPLFYAFHNFLDYSFEKWLQEHGDAGITGTGRSNRMRAEQDLSLPKPLGWTAAATPPRDDSYTPNMGRADLYFDTIKQGYGYQPRYGGEFVYRDVLQTLIDQHQGAGFVFGDNAKSLFAALLSDQAADGTVGKPHVVISRPYTVPRKPVAIPAKRYLKVTRAHLARDYSFQLDVYLHPASVKADLNDQRFRDRYLVTTTSHWALSGHPSHDSTCIAVDVTGIVNSLTPQPGRRKVHPKWQLTAAATTNDKGATTIQTDDFSAPQIVADNCPQR